jgi:hypothetical protein
MSDAEIAYSRIERALIEGWYLFGNGFTVTAKVTGNAWLNAANAHDYETSTGNLPVPVPLDRALKGEN